MFEKIYAKYLSSMVVLAWLAVLYLAYYIYNDPSYIEKMRRSKIFFEIIYNYIWNTWIIIFVVTVGIVITVLWLKSLFFDKE